MPLHHSHYRILKFAQKNPSLTLEQIANEFSCTTKRVSRVLRKAFHKNLTSLDQLIDPDEEIRLLDLIEDSEESSEEQMAIREEQESQYQQIQEVLPLLKEKEQIIIKECFNDSKKSQKAISKELNISEGRVTQIRNEAINKIKRLLDPNTPVSIERHVFKLKKANQFEQVLSQLKEKEEIVLRMHFNGTKLNDIAKEIKRSPASACQIKKKGIQNLLQIIERLEKAQ